MWLDVSVSLVYDKGGLKRLLCDAPLAALPPRVVIALLGAAATAVYTLSLVHCCAA